MSGVTGDWDLVMKTPLGSFQARYTFHVQPDGCHGTAESAGETVPLSNVFVAPDERGERVTWSQRITSPMRLNLEFNVIVEGDTITGHSRAGRLPRSTVTGHRVRTAETR